MVQKCIAISVLVTFLNAVSPAFAGDFVNPNLFPRGFSADGSTMFSLPPAAGFRAVSQVATDAPAASTNNPVFRPPAGLFDLPRMNPLSPPSALAGLRRDPGVLLLPQIQRPDPAAIRPAPAKPNYWSRRRLVWLAAGLGLAGLGAALFVTGKDNPNPDYNLSACAASFNSGPIPYNGDACNETKPSRGKVAGVLMMAGGGPIAILALLLRHL